MLYFKLVSLFWGATLAAFGFFYFFSPKSWVSFFAGKLWAASGPVMIMPLFLLHLVLSLVGWVICFTSYKHAFAYLVSGLLTLGAVKLACILPAYANFRKVMELLVTTEKFACMIFALGSLVMGGGLIFLGAVIH